MKKIINQIIINLIIILIITLQLKYINYILIFSRITKIINKINVKKIKRKKN